MNQETYTLFGKDNIRPFSGIPTARNMKTELSDIEIAKTENGIYRFFRHVNLFHQKRKMAVFSYNDLLNVFGLAYTSSSDFAMFTNTNSEIFLQTGKFSNAENAEARALAKYSIRHFAVSNAGEIVCICLDAQENEFNFIIGKI